MHASHATPAARGSLAPAAFTPPKVSDVSAILASVEAAHAATGPVTLRFHALPPEHRVVVDCLPELLSCEKRLEARLQGRPGSVGWCTAAIQAAAPGFDPPRLKPPRREKTGKRAGWFGRRRRR